MSDLKKLEEKEKDNVLQAIHDELESLEWGDGCDKLVMKIVLDGKFKLRPIRSFKNYKRPLRCF